MSYLKALCMAVMLGVTCRLTAQYDPAFNHYWALQTLYNPAAAGLLEQVNVQGAYALQMMGYTHAPQTMVVTADLPLWMISRAHGVGAGFVNDKLGLFEHKKFYIEYAYHQKLWGGRLSAGVRGALLAESFDGTGLDVIDSGDPAFPSSEVNGTAFDFEAGLRYDGRDWYAGLSALHVLQPTVKLGDSKSNEFVVPRTYYLTGGYNIRLKNPFLSVQPSLLARTDMVAWRVDVTGRLVYQHENKMMYLGATYSPKTSVTMLVGGSFHGIVVGYSYEFYTSLSPINGSHELFVGYQQDINLVKKGKNRHQSVRIL